MEVERGMVVHTDFHRQLVNAPDLAVDSWNAGRPPLSRRGAAALLVGGFALAHPGYAQGIQGAAVQGFLGHGKDEALFLVEMVAGSHDSDLEELARGFQAATAQGLLEMFIDFLVFIVKGFLLTDLCKAMFERLDQEFILDLGMGLKRCLEHTGEGMHFSQALEFWEDGFDVVEHVVEHRVFGEQGFSNLHSVSGRNRIVAGRYSTFAGAWKPEVRRGLFLCCVRGRKLLPLDSCNLPNH
jgi:hypothetical protein